MNHTIALKKSYSHCRNVAKREAGNFYYSFLLLPKEKRYAMCAIYAFMRHSDDLSDNAATINKKTECLQNWRKALQNAYTGIYGNNLIFPAFHDTVKKYNIPIEYFEELISGTEMDLSISSYQTFPELYKYCYRVAGVVGLVCLHLYGFNDEKAKKLAEICGIGFQLTNILRDLEEDATMGRVYLPLDDFSRFNYNIEDLKNKIVNEKFISFMDFQVNRARNYYEQSKPLLKMVNPESRPALSAIMGIYRGVLEKIASYRYMVFGKRVRLNTLEKLAIVAKAYLQPVA